MPKSKRQYAIECSRCGAILMYVSSEPDQPFQLCDECWEKRKQKRLAREAYRALQWLAEHDPEWLAKYNAGELDGDTD